MNKFYETILLIFFIVAGLAVNSQSLYFPPNGSNTWDTISPSSLNWCDDRIDSFNDFSAIGRIGYLPFTLLIEYRISDYIKGGFPQQPKIKLGISILIEPKD